MAELTRDEVSDNLWKGADRAVLMARDPAWIEGMESKNDAHKTMALILVRTGKIPQEQRGNWFDDARQIAQDIIPDGVERWLSKFEAAMCEHARGFTMNNLLSALGTKDQDWNVIGHQG